MDREKVIDAFKERISSCSMIGDGFDVTLNWKLADDILALLKEQETVIRCKDCKYGEPWGVLIGCGTAKGFGITHKPDWFCADGERKEDK